MIVYVELTDLEVTEKKKCSFICHLNLLLAVNFFNGKKIYRQANFKTYVSQIGSTGMNSLVTLKELCKKRPVTKCRKFTKFLMQVSRPSTVET